MRKRILLILLICSVSLAWADGNAFNSALEVFSQGEYDEALLAFRNIILDEDQSDFHAESYFWIAKSYLALGDLENAERNLEFFLVNFRESGSYQEAVYQKGRLLYLQEEYEACLQLLSGFIEIYPNSLFLPNSLFWIGESLFSLGFLDEAQIVFRRIIAEYPSSYKIESARYRVTLIDMQIREREILRLLKWSQEEFLAVQEDFFVRESSYQDAIASYQQQLSEQYGAQSRDQIAELNAEISEKNELILQLQEAAGEDEEQISELEEQIIYLNGQLESFQSVISELSAGGFSGSAAGSTVTGGNLQSYQLQQLLSQAEELEAFYTVWLAEKGVME